MSARGVPRGAGATRCRASKRPVFVVTLFVCRARVSSEFRTETAYLVRLHRRTRYAVEKREHTHTPYTHDDGRHPRVRRLPGHGLGAGGDFNRPADTNARRPGRRRRQSAGAPTCHSRGVQGRCRDESWASAISRSGGRASRVRSRRFLPGAQIRPGSPPTRRTAPQQRPPQGASSRSARGGRWSGAHLARACRPCRVGLGSPSSLTQAPPIDQRGLVGLLPLTQN